MKPLQHAHKSVGRFQVGTWEDYLDVHEFLDQTKAYVPDMRHRAILHNSFGIFLAERFFGSVRVIDGREVSVRSIAEQHILDDLGFIPRLDECIEDIPLVPGMWLGGATKRERFTA